MDFLKKYSFLILFLGIILCHAQDSMSMEKNTPVSNQGKKWRIGYLQGGNHEEFIKIMKGFTEGLMRLGWMKQTSIPEQVKLSGETENIWQWMSQDMHSDYIEFVRDAYWDGGWDEKRQQEKKDEIVKRLYIKKDLDIIIAMGTVAGKALASDSNRTNIMVMLAIDPIFSKIVYGREYSGRKYIHATIEPDYFKNDIRFFYKNIRFKNLGIVYKNSPEGEIYSAINYIEEVKKEKGDCFNIIKCRISDYDINEIIRCHNSLAPKIDAMYITPNLEIQQKDMLKLMEPMLKYNLPTWSAQTDNATGMSFDMVKYGVLMSFSKETMEYFNDIGFFEAKVMAQILQGTRPGEVKQIFINPKNNSISLNLKTAKLIKFNPSFDILAAAKTVYEEIGE